MFARLTATLTLLRAVQRAELDHQIEALLPGALTQLADLLDLKHKTYSRLRCDSDTTYIYYVSNASSSLHAGRENEALLFSLVQQTLESSHSDDLISSIKNGSIKSTSDLLQAILSQGSVKSPMKPEYLAIITMLAELIVFLLSIHQESELRLANYIEKCMELEALFIQKFKTQMNHLISLEDTQNLVENLNVLVHGSDYERTDINRIPLEVQEFFETENPVPVKDTAQKFACTSTYLNRLYQAFLQVRSLSHKTSQEPRNKRKYIIILLELFKKHLKTEYLEVDEFSVRELKTNYLYDKFLKQIIPPRLFAGYSNVSEHFHFFPEENPNNFVDLQTSTFDDTMISQNQSLMASSEVNDGIGAINLSQQDQNKLVQQLNILIPQLTDYFEFNLEFPQVMKIYLKLLFGGQYFVEDNDIEFVKQIINNTNIIVDFENGDTSAAIEIEETIGNLHSIHFNLTPETTTDKTLIMRLALVEHLNWIKVGTKFLKHWNYRLLSMLQLHELEQNYHEENSRKYLAVWYNFFMKNRQLNTTASSYSDQKLLESTLMVCLKKLDTIASQNQIAKNFHQKRFLRKWVKKLKSFQLLNEKANKISIEKCISLYWGKLTLHYTKKAELTANSNILAEKLVMEKAVMTKRIVLNNWVFKCTTLDDPRYIRLEEAYKMFAHKKFFNIWKSKHNLETHLVKVRRNLDASLQKFFFKHMKNRTDLNALAKDVFARTNKQIATNVLAHWNELLKRCQMADAFLRKKTLEQWFKNWMLRSRLKNLGLEAKLAAMFKVWVLQNKLKNFTEICNGLRTKRFFNHWKKKRQNYQLMLDKSRNLSEVRYLNLAMTIWMRQIEFKTSLEEVASLNVQRKFLNKFYKCYATVKALDLKIANNRKSLTDQVVLKLSLTVWVDAYNKNFEAAMMPTITQFREKVSNRYLASRFVNQWVERYNLKQEKTKLMNERCLAFSRQLSLCVNIFTKWQSMSDKNKELSNAAINFNNQVLYKRHLMTWYNLFIRVETLEEAGEAFASRRDLHIARELLNKWSMKNIKARRNQQSCALFLDRWKSVKARSIFELWLYKIRHKNHEDEGEPDADISYMTASQSPLAYKQRFDTREESYLSTPIKKRDRQAFTPVARTSPTKLQETTERLRGERMSALIKHYQKARTNSRKRSSTLFQTKKLSPPERPVFDQFVSKPDVESEIETVFNRSPSYEDILTVETAKLLKRITPIFVPTEEEELAPRFSPASRLKSRINLNRSPIAESPVYPSRYL